MKNHSRPPTSLTDFKGKPPRVEVTRESIDDADRAATIGMLERYTQPDGFHCPRCGEVITDPEEAVYHLADEINQALDRLGGQPNL